MLWWYRGIIDNIFPAWEHFDNIGCFFYCVDAVLTNCIGRGVGISYDHSRESIQN